MNPAGRCSGLGVPAQRLALRNSRAWRSRVGEATRPLCMPPFIDCLHVASHTFLLHGSLRSDFIAYFHWIYFFIIFLLLWDFCELLWSNILFIYWDSTLCLTAIRFTFLLGLCSLHYCDLMHIFIAIRFYGFPPLNLLYLLLINSNGLLLYIFFLILGNFLPHPSPFPFLIERYQIWPTSYGSHSLSSRHPRS